jgi:L-threonylcarbamoyladenylate synthase
MIRSDSETTRAEAARIISTGGVIAFRTDTFYGLGADPFNPTALQKIRKLKGREENKPILLLISNLDQLGRFVVEQSSLFRSLATRFWPGPLTLIAAARSELPTELTAGTNSIGVRLPDDEDVRRLVSDCGGALTATSANISGRPPARSATEVDNYFSEEIDLIIDDGEVGITKPSTVLDVSGTEPRLVREGAVSREKLAAILKTIR